MQGNPGGHQNKTKLTTSTLHIGQRNAMDNNEQGLLQDKQGGSIRRPNNGGAYSPSVPSRAPQQMSNNIQEDPYQQATKNLAQEDDGLYEEDRQVEKKRKGSLSAQERHVPMQQTYRSPSESCCCCFPLGCGMLILTVFQALVIGHLVYTFCLVHRLPQIMHVNGVESKQVNYEFDHFYYSQKFIYIMLGIDSIKVYGLFVMLCWSCNDNDNTRGWLVSAHFVNVLSSLASCIFAFVFIYASPDTFFPNGLTAGGQFFNTVVASVSIVPMLFYIYFTIMARKYRDIKREDKKKRNDAPVHEAQADAGRN